MMGRIRGQGGKQGGIVCLDKKRGREGRAEVGRESMRERKGIRRRRRAGKGEGQLIRIYSAFERRQ